MRRVSWNGKKIMKLLATRRHASHEACELKLPKSCLYRCWLQSRLAWGVWVEILRAAAQQRHLKSRLAWGVWVEMQKFSESVEALFGVTPRMRRVSWNNSQEFGYFIFNVTPRMRRVSWNHFKGYCPNLWWCHASHEACELKYWSCSRWSQVTKSRLAWGVWVEIIQ